MNNDLRQAWLKKLCIPENFNNLQKNEKLKLVLNDPNNIQHTAQYIVSIMDQRSLLNKMLLKKVLNCNLSIMSHPRGTSYVTRLRSKVFSLGRLCPL